MKTIKSNDTLTVPEGVTVEIRNREVKVTGPRGTLRRSFQHAQLNLTLEDNVVTAEVWFGGDVDVSIIKTCLSAIRNMITGVTLGYKYKMRFAYAHFPVGVTVEGQQIQIRNFLGEKYVRRVTMPEGVTATRTEVTVMKDELVIEGNCINAVSQTAAQVHGVCLVKRKDIRKFLDGIYVSEKTTITV
eukprot:TRINITY_DN225_c0_g4_i1.p1 TRINITY_DN225_c0_g4~~TRINITY_DN225_c0_g4_i1.p1  ORF type:complete len:187 (+),score=85.04 TRINITY_DN225_c0_g4_i1:68-628(+)